MELIMINQQTYKDEEGLQISTFYTAGKYSIEKVETFYHGEYDASYIIQGDPEAEYLPRIYYRKRFGEPTGHFEIATTSYGSKTWKEIDEVIAGYKEAQDAVKLLDNDLYFYRSLGKFRELKEV